MSVENVRFHATSTGLLTASAAYAVLSTVARTMRNFARIWKGICGTAEGSLDVESDDKLSRVARVPDTLWAHNRSESGSCLAATTLRRETDRTDRATVRDSGKRELIRLHGIDETIIFTKH